MPHDSKETYIGDGVYASYDPAQMIMLRTSRHHSNNRFDTDGGVVHWIALEREVLFELVMFAHTIGWGQVVRSAMQRATGTAGGHPAPDHWSDHPVKEAPDE